MKTIRLVIAAVVVAAVTPASSDTAPSSAPTDQRLATAEAMREGARAGSLAGVLAGAGIEGTASLATGIPEISREVPPHLRSPLRALVQAALTADRLARTAFPDRQALRRGARALILRRDVAAASTVSADRGALRAGAAAIAAATDALVRAARAGGAPIASEAAPACDVQRVDGVLCVSGAGSSTVQKGDNFLVSVDLGGDDTYLNATGTGACLDHETPTDSYCASVAVDLGGDDRYGPGEQLHACEVGGRTAPFPVCGQGVGMGGIGVLVDAEGNDSYTAEPVARDGDCNKNFDVCGFTVVQASALYGVGVLADLSGDDTYAIRVPASLGTSGDRSLTIRGQANGTIGDAVLWDDAGNDSYLMEGPSSGWVTGANWTRSGIPYYEGQGLGTLGNGVILDSAGNDSFVVRTRPGDGAAQRTAASPWGEGGAVNFDGQGWGTLSGTAGALGAIITGKGATTYELDFTARMLAFTRSQGWGPGGLISDDGGDDVYRVRGRTIGDFSVACACPDVGAEFDSADGFVNFAVNRLEYQSQGSSQGLIRDRSGDDRYELLANGRIAVEASSHGDAEAIAADVGSVNLIGQGGGGGEIRDDAGDDAYLVSAENEVSARAQGSGAVTAIARAGFFSTSVQGAGGRIIDLGGADSYEVRARQHATADPQSEVPDDGQLAVHAHGMAPSGDGVGIFDTDAGAPDRFHLESPHVFTACRGAYGSSPGWSGGQRRMLMANGAESCSSSGTALVSSAQPRTAPSLEMIDATRVAGGWTVRARVMDAVSDVPIAGTRVRFGLQVLSGYPYWGVGPWQQWAESSRAREAVTGSDGVATATVAFAPCGEGCDAFGVAAQFFGDATRAPTTARIGVTP